MRRFLLVLVVLMSGEASIAQDRMSALARLEPGSIIRDAGENVEVTLQMSQEVPYRIYHLADPWRIVFEFSEVEFSPISHGSLDQSQKVIELRSGAVRPGWSRLVVQTDEAMRVAAIEQIRREDLGATLGATLVPQDETAFRESAGLPEALQQQPEITAASPVGDAAEDGRLRIMIDPGHGGIDPGAQSGDVIEAELMLTVATALREALVRTDQFEVALTRDADVFVPLETRVSLAHQFRADVFISLHADVVLEGQARGAALYTLSEKATDIASQKLAERHSREDLLAGVDLSQQDDAVAFVLMDIARTETMHRTHQLADRLVETLGQKVELHKRPKLQAGFSVLKAPDFPSVLIELGFMSSKHDLENLVDPEWQARAISGIVEGLQAWAAADAEEKALRKK